MEEEEWWCLPEHIITNTFQRISTTTEWKKFSHLPNSLYTRWDRCNENYDNENLHVPPIKAEIYNFLPQVFFSSTFIPLGRRRPQPSLNERTLRGEYLCRIQFRLDFHHSLNFFANTYTPFSIHPIHWKVMR